MPIFPEEIELSALNGVNGFTIDNTGIAVSSAGDINGDGLEDVLIGSSGEAYVVYGRDGGLFPALIAPGDLDGRNGFKIDGTGASSQAGYNLAVAGDINGDGIDDVVIGSVGDGAWVVFGNDGGFDPVTLLVDLDGNNGFRVESNATDFVGGAVGSAGDVNGDGYDDVIVGASGADPGGRSYVIFGKPGGFDASLDPAALDGSNGFALQGGPGSEYSGVSVASAGDLNGDGIDDIIIGAQADAGAAYVVFGKTSGFSANVLLSDLEGDDGFRIQGVVAYSNTGHSVASAGDVNGDGFDDMVIGAPRGDDGRAYVIFGASDGLDTIDLSELDGANGFEILGQSNSFGLAGWSVASAGDVNGDGFDDVIVGAQNADPNGNSSGAAYVVLGAASGFAASLSLDTLNGNNGFRMNGPDSGDYTGRSVSSAGDLNGDGFDDVVVANRFSSASFVVFGARPVQAVDRVGTVASQTLAGGGFDDTLRGLGGDDELFGNGGNDVLKGASGQDILRGGRGAADELQGGGGRDTYVYFDAVESTGDRHDSVYGFDFDGKDRFDLASKVTGVDVAIENGELSSASFDADLALAVGAVHLGVRHAVLFTPDSGDLAGEVFLVVDTNKTAGYQAGDDLVIRLENTANTVSLDVSDFI